MSLNKKWKELVYAASGIGPNLLMVLMMAYYTDAVYPVGLKAGKEVWSVTGYSLIYPAVWGLCWTLVRIFDGIINVPLAHLTDNLRTKWGRRRPMIVMAFIPMVLSYLFLWLPIEYRENSVANTVWIIAMAAVHFVTYTMCMLAFYGSLSSVCHDEAQRTRVSNFKSFFDTIGYCIIYALFPVFLGMGFNIRDLVFKCMPLMLTMLIPLFLIKEGVKYEGEGALDVQTRTGFFASLKTAFGNKLFMGWMIPNALSFFGLQLFLSAQNAMISGWMELGPSYAAIMNTCAFAPVPLMLYLYYRLYKKHGIRIAYRTALLFFSVAILSFLFGGSVFWGNDIVPKLIIGCIGGIFGSYSIGAFFSMPYLVPSQIASMELALTKKDNTAMYFAVQAILTSIAGAISTGVVYEYIKGLQVFGIERFGLAIVPCIVSVGCIVGAIFCMNIPKHYTRELVAKRLGIELDAEE